MKQFVIVLMIIIVIGFLTFLVYVATSSKDMEDIKITNKGMKELSPGIFIKKFDLDNDRIYLLVDEKGNLIGSPINTCKTVTNGKYSKTETDALLK